MNTAPEALLLLWGSLAAPVEEWPFAKVTAEIQIKGAAGNLLAIITPETDGTADAWIANRLNDECTLTFRLPANNSKVQYLTDSNYIHCEVKVFVLQGPDAVKDEHIDGKLWTTAQARERWVELDRSQVTVCNDTDYEPIRDQEVIITKTGTAAGGYAAGSAGSALTYLLDGSGWTLDTVDVTGSYEIKSHQESSLSNIKRAQEMWGGYLVWDSLNKKLSHRADTWEPYSGYQIRLGKNQKGLTRLYNFDVVTKLFVYGQNDVDVYDVNVLHSGTCAGAGANTITLAAGAYGITDAYRDGYVIAGGETKRIICYNGATKVATLESNWSVIPTPGVTAYEIRGRFILNFSYKSAVRVDTWRNQDIIDPAELLTKGTAALEELAAPRVTYKLQHVDRRTLFKHRHEGSGDLTGQMVDVIDDVLGVAVQVRVIYHRYNVFMPWLCDIELGSESYELRKIIGEMRKNSRVTYRLGRNSSTLTIADGSTTKNTQRADYIIPPGSTEAQEMINRVALLMPRGGKITLLDGTFLADQPILLPSDLKLEGQGTGTILQFKDGITLDGRGIIENIDPAGGNTNIAVSNLLLNGRHSHRSSGFARGISLTKTTKFSISKVYGTDLGLYGVYADQCQGGRIEGLTAFTANARAVYFTECSDSSILGCVIDHCGGAITFYESSNCIISGCNLFENIGEGIYFGGICVQNTIANNTISKNYYEGILFQISGSAGNTIINNLITENSQTLANRYDGIRLAGYADQNLLQTNVIRSGGKQRYGVNIASSTCDGNIITNNDLRASGVTGSLNDAGTGTIVAAGNQL